MDKELEEIFTYTHTHITPKHTHTDTKLTTKHLEIYMTSFPIGKMQAKTTLSYLYSPLKLVKIQKFVNKFCLQIYGKTKIVTHCWRESKLVQLLQ